ncbi:MAG: hypothetical protein ACR2FV_12090 [Ornithinimicrobium sp.]|uniref:hypothetical protein n=1 Tax=Ornithinimicrobium sp. TaxID=1977084 RepID=UPI0017FFFE84|nr:hypothetical protein [Actinomycetota bacterium]
MTSLILGNPILANAEGGGHAAADVLFEPIWIGVIAMVIFLALLALLWSFRNTLALDPHHSSGTEADEVDPDSGRGSSR